MKRVILIIATLFIFSIEGHSQDLFFQRGEVWFQEIFKIRKNDGLFHIDFAGRSNDWFSNFNRFHVRTGGGYIINDHWSVFGMLGYFYTNTGVSKVHDCRINFDANYKTNIFNSRVLFNYRIRQAYRRILGIEGYENSLRMRNRFGITVPINNPAIQKNTWYFQFEDELFFELLEWNPNFLGSNRVVSSFGWYLNPNISFELSYCWETDFVLEDNIIFGNHIFWLKFNQTIDLSGKGKKRSPQEE